jgi:DNA primase
LEGVKVPNTIKNLAQKKDVIAFLDGDRGGDLILQELLQVARPTYVARAPRGKEVEELSPEEIQEALAKKVPLEESLAKRAPPEEAPAKKALPEEAPVKKVSPEEAKAREELVGVVNGLRGTLEAVLLKGDGSQAGRIPVSELVDKLKDTQDVSVVVFDGIVTGRLIDTAKEKNVNTIIGERVAEGVRIPRGLDVKSFRDLS